MSDLANLALNDIVWVLSALAIWAASWGWLRYIGPDSLSAVLRAIIAAIPVLAFIALGLAGAQEYVRDGVTWRSVILTGAAIVLVIALFLRGSERSRAGTLSIVTLMGSLWAVRVWFDRGLGAAALTLTVVALALGVLSAVFFKNEEHIEDGSAWKDFMTFVWLYILVLLGSTAGVLGAWAGYELAFASVPTGLMLTALSVAFGALSYWAGLEKKLKWLREKQGAGA